MRSRLVFSVLLAATGAVFVGVVVEAAACAQICYTTELTGFGPGGVPGCSCSGSAAGARRGEGDCNCGQCYEKNHEKIFGFALNSDSTCTYGTNCGNCDLVSGTSTNAPTTPTPTGTTPVPTGTTSVSTSTTSTPTSTTPVPTSTTSTPTSTTSTPVSVVAIAGSSSSTKDETSIGASATNSFSASDSSAASDSSNSYSDSSTKAGNNAGSESGSNSKENHLSQWQIVLAICCSVLFFIVAVVSVCGCYCKARRRLNEDEQANYYNQHTQQTVAFQPWSANETKSNIV